MSPYLSMFARVFGCAALLVSALSLAAEPPAVSHDGLELVPDAKAQLLYRRPGATLAANMASTSSLPSASRTRVSFAPLLASSRARSFDEVVERR